MRNGGSIMAAFAWVALAAFAADPAGPWLHYHGAVFADDCLAPDFAGRACAPAPREDGGEPAPSASAALLPVDGPPRQERAPRQESAPPQESAPRLGYALAELLMIEEETGYGGGR